MKTNYVPQPLDTSEVSLPSELTKLTELFAKNTHEVWAQQRMSEGWRYGAERDDKEKLHPCLVAYEDLPDSEKEYDSRTAMEAIRLIVKCGYEIKRTERAKPSFHVVENEKYILWTSNEELPSRDCFGEISDGCFLMLDANVLRRSGAMISTRVSWERSATELVWQLQNNPSLSYLNKAPHILITFAQDGAVYIQREKAVLVLAHGGAEGDSGDFAAMTEALALQFVDVMAGKSNLRILPILGNSSNDNNAVEAAYEIPPVQNDIDPGFWCITNNLNNRRIFDLAFDYVQKGSNVIGGLPQLSFGNLTTIDRQEIESYQNIRNLILNYTLSDNVRPLSIAVFGAPGSGKSFGVTEIAKNILPGKVEKIEFNVSQFTDNVELGAAFQQVRDITLNGKLPLVFFDEFDSDKLRWLKSFLMPMQDGKFKDESGEHPLGKCILVFAGGTSANFEQFTRPMTAGNTEEQQTFRDLKVPDFISRLRGTINVLGPNRQNETDKNYMLRRALLLRSLCERKMKLGKDKETQINETILWAMLLIPTYKYGARSMESIFDMSRINGKQWETADLPFHAQLSLHVDAEVFIRLVLRKMILNSYKEKLAIAIHEDFCRKNPTSDNNIPWAELPEDIKDSNRDQAHSFGEYLNIAGYDFDSGDTPFPSIKEITKDEIVKIAQLSHEIWMKSKTDAGWRYGNIKDAAQKTHPLLVEWDKLPDKEKQKDEDIAENIIPLMESIGLRVYRVI
jgi:hypothetical protein